MYNNKLNMLYMQTPIKLTLDYEGDSYAFIQPMFNNN